jgi:hypothetical protein
MNTTTFTLAAAVALLLTVGGSGIAQAQEPSAEERVAELHAAMAASQAALREYEWVETTVVSMKGEEKSRKQASCHYGADGKVEKVEIDASPAPEKKRGVRGRIVERKTEELTDYMKSAVGLVKTYVPPDPAKIQAAKEAGTVSLEPVEPGQRVRLIFRDYEKPGDTLAMDLDVANNLPLSLSVDSYLDDAKDAVMLDVIMSQLDDGSIYASDITLNAVAKELVVTVQNGSYQKIAN